MIENNILRAACTEEWVARTYGEYLESKSDYYLTMLDDFQAAIDSGLDRDFDQLEKSNDAIIAEINDLILEKAEQAHVDLASLDSTSQEYASFLLRMSTDSDVEALVSEHYDDSQFIMNNFSYYFRPNTVVSYDLDFNYQPGYVDFSDMPAAMPNLIEMNKTFKSYCTTTAQELLTERGWTSEEQIEPIALNHGYSDMKTICAALISNVGSGNIDMGKLNLNLKDIDGNVLNGQYEFGYGYSFASLVQEVKTNYSTTIETAAALKSSVLSTVADRVSAFTAAITDKLSTIGSTISNLGSAWRDKLSNSVCSVRSIMNEFINLTGWNNIHSSVDVPSTNDTSEIYQMTGANPSVVLDFSVAGNILGATARTIGVSIAALATGLYNLISGIVRKISSYLYTTLINPYDLEKLDNNSQSGLIDKYNYQIHDIRKITVRNSSTCPIVTEIVNEYKNRWCGYKSVFGESFHTFDFILYNNWAPTGTYNNQYYNYVEVTSQFKPKPINPLIVGRIGEVASSVTGYNHVVANSTRTEFSWKTHLLPNETIDEYENWWLVFLEMLNNTEDLYCDVGNTDEVRMNQSYVLATILEQQMERASLFILNNRYGWNANYNPDVNEDPYEYILIDDVRQDVGITQEQFNLDCQYAESVPSTNLDFLKSACGYDNHNFNPSFSGSLEFACIPMILLCRAPSSAFDPNDDYDSPQPEKLASPVNFLVYRSYFAYALLENLLDRKINPNNFAYLPYSNSVDDFSVPSYRIKTDIENISVAQSFVTKVVTIVTIAAVAGAAVLGVKRFLRNRYFKKAAAIGKMDDAMWKGSKLTNSEQKRYVRYSRKLNKSNLLGTGVSNESNSNLIDNLQNMASKVDTLYGQITGTGAPDDNVLPAANQVDTPNAENGLIKSISDRIS